MSRAGIGTAVLVLLAVWLASCDQTANTTTTQPPSYFRIVDAVNSGSTYAYAPSIIVKDGTYHVFFCSMAVLIPTWDAIRYTTSTDGNTWSAPQIMVLPSWENGMDMAACDPSLVFYQGFYYLYYSSAMTTAPNVFQTIIEVARSVNIDGPYSLDSLPDCVPSECCCLYRTKMPRRTRDPRQSWREVAHPVAHLHGNSPVLLLLIP